MCSENKTKVLISDSLSEEGVKDLEKAGFAVKMDSSLDGELLKNEISGYDALIIRSGTNVTAEIIESADKLKVIGRAGVGVDNVDIDAATRKGIVVMNTPGGNTISACEHTWALILSLMRNVPPAHQALKEGRWDKKKYKGTELYGKTLGVIGLGKIGLEVARRALCFGMKVLAFDPYTSQDVVNELGAELVDLNVLLADSDIITVHVPKNEKTKNMINRETLTKMKKGVFFVNCARGGIVNEKDLAEAVKSGHVKGAAVDVYEKEPTTDSPLFAVDGVIHTPHLGASTSEAQERVAVEIVKQVIEYFGTDKIINAVNITGAKIESGIKELAHRLGMMAGQLSEHIASNLLISYRDNIAGEQEESVVRAVMNGYLSQFNEGINYVNAIMVAEEKGINIIKQKGTRINVKGDINIKLDDEVEVSGGFIGNIPRLTGINGYSLDIPLSGNLLLIKNADVPGVIGHIGTVLGEGKVNIAYMEVGRKSAGGRAVTVISIDHEVSEKIMNKLKSQDSVESVTSLIL